MPRVPAADRKPYIEGHTEVLDWEIEETLLRGEPKMFGPPAWLRTIEEWRREWSRWRGVILPKCIEHCPGTRPVAMYVCGEIPARTLAVPLPPSHRWRHVEVQHPGNEIRKHWLNVPPPFMEPEARHLYREGIIDAAELRRHREWAAQRAAGRESSAVDTYRLEMALHE